MGRGKTPPEAGMIVENKHEDNGVREENLKKIQETTSSEELTP